MKQMYSASAVKPGVTVNSKHPVDESASKTDRPKKMKNIQSGTVGMYYGF